MKAAPGAIPKEHDQCDIEPCMQCEADAELTGSDMHVLNFWRRVEDQVVLLSPAADEDGRVWHAPRLEAWIAACDLYGIPLDERRDLIEQARALHELVHKRYATPGLFTMDPALLREV